MKFAIITIFCLGFLVQPTQSRTSCGSHLIDFLEDACGANGISNNYGRRMAIKYPNLKGRFSRHTQLPVPEHLLLQMIELISPETADDLANDSTNGLSNRVLSRVSSSSRRKRRTRRDIVKMCCYNRCSLKSVRRLYCARS